MPGYLTNPVGGAIVINGSQLFDYAQQVFENEPIDPFYQGDTWPYFADWQAIGFDQATADGGMPDYPDLMIIPNSYAGDVHNRWYVVPQTLNLSNPKLNTNIPFLLWNTFGEEQTISSFLVSGTSSLQFDIGIGTSFTVGEYKTANVKILPGDPAIDAEMQFITQDGTGILNIIASLAETFNIIPEIPVREIWQYKTDIIISHNGSEQRHSLMPKPRVNISFKTLIKDERARRSQYNLLFGNIQFESLVPLYQYATNLTQETPVGGLKLFLDMKRTNFRVGLFAVAVEPKTQEIFIGRVQQVDADGIVLGTAASQDLSTKWIVAPALNCLVSNGSGFLMNSVSGSIQIDADSFEEPTVVRPNATRTASLFDGIVHLDRRPLISAKEAFDYRREIIDNEVGVRILKSADPHPTIAGPRTFVIQRVSDPDEMDYWRSFVDQTRGAFKPFLLSTWFADLTLAEPVAQGVAQIEVNEGFYASSYFPFETWKRIQIEYENGDTTQHLVTSVNETPLGTAQLSLLPSLPNDPAYTLVKKISYLLKVMGDDTITLEHEAAATYITIQIKTTDFG